MSNDALTALTLDLRQLAPETKYFLIGLINLYPLGKSVVFKVRDLADTLAVADSVVTSGIHELEDSQLVSIGTEVSDGGESTRTLTVTLDKASVYSRSTGAKKKHSHTPKATPCYHTQRIESLLLTARQIKKKKSLSQATPGLKQLNETVECSVKTSKTGEYSFGNKLTVSNRLTLMVLLRYADSCGVVRHLGMTDLECLTGIRASKLEGQLEKLKQTGYIRTSYSGISQRGMFGVAPGGYFLNVSHPGFGDRAKPSVTLVYETPKPLEDVYSLIANEAKALIQIVDEFKISGVATIDNECELARATTNSQTGMSDPEPASPNYTFGKRPAQLGVLLSDLRQYPKSFYLLEHMQGYQPNIPLSIDYRMITGFFEYQNRANFCRFLQVRIDQLVSLLMTDYWPEIQNKDLKLNDAIRTIIHELFLPIRKQPTPPPEGPPDSKKNLNVFTALIFETALTATERLQKALACIDIVQEDMAFSILPSQIFDNMTASRYRALQMFHKPHTGNPCSGHYHLQHTQTEKGIVQVNMSLEAVKNSTYQFDSGLMTKPRKKYDLDWVEDRDAQKNSPRSS
jgi:DNA-binding MarR family transcriptional regulator